MTEEAEYMSFSTKICVVRIVKNPRLAYSLWRIPGTLNGKHHNFNKGH